MSGATIGLEIKGVQGTQGMQGVQNAEGLIDRSKFETVNTQSDRLDNIIDLIQELLRKKDLENNENKRKINLPTPFSNDTRDLRNGANGIINFATAGSNAVTNFANGNVPGIIADGSNSLGRSLLNKGLSDDGISKGLIGLGIAGIVASLAIKGTKALADAYGNATEGMDNLLLNYGNITADSSTNSKSALNLRKSLLNKMSGTGLDYEEFVSLTNSFAGNGVSDINRAGELAKESALWARRTGIDVSQTSGIVGLVERMGGNGTDFLTSSFKAAKASGLTDNQYGEFLDGIRTAMEQGISKGFKLSADDIGKNLSYVSMLSGNNPLWEGKYGAQRYINMSNAMANNTSLQNTSSMLMYQASKNALVQGNKSSSEIDVLKFMESGQWGDPNFLESLRTSLSGAYGNDTLSKIASLKEMFGLNWAGGEMVLNIVDNTTKTPEELKKEIEDVVADNSFRSDETNRQDALNEINNAVVDVGRNAYVAQTALTDVGATVAKIYEYLTQSEPDYRLIPSDSGPDIEKALNDPQLRPHTLNLLEQNWHDTNNDKVMNSWEVTDKEGIIEAIRKLAEALNLNTEATKANTENDLEIVEESTSSSSTSWGPRYY